MRSTTDTFRWVRSRSRTFQAAATLGRAADAEYRVTARDDAEDGQRQAGIRAIEVVRQLFQGLSVCQDGDILRRKVAGIGSDGVPQPVHDGEEIHQRAHTHCQ